MGFFSKVFKGVKKVFKKIGKGIKSAFKSVGKFMGKLGIIGQIGLGLLLPGIGALLGKTAGFLMGSANPLLQGAGKFINAAINVGTKTGKVFSTVTEGVTKVIGETVGAVANKIPGMDKLVSSVSDGAIDIQNKNFESVFKTVGEEFSKTSSAATDLFSSSTLTDVNKYTAASLDAAQAAKKEDIVTNLDATTEYSGPLDAKDVSSGFEEYAVDGTIPQVPASERPSIFESTSDIPDGTVDTEKPSLLQRGMKKGAEALSDMPSKFVSQFTAASAQKAAGAFPDQNVYYGAVADLGGMGASSIGTGDYQQDFNPNMYLDNTNYINQYPVGQTAGLYNVYQNFMSRGAVS